MKIFVQGMPQNNRTAFRSSLITQNELAATLQQLTLDLNCDTCSSKLALRPSLSLSGGTLREAHTVRSQSSRHYSRQLTIVRGSYPGLSLLRAVLKVIGRFFGTHCGIFGTALRILYLAYVPPM